MEAGVAAETGSCSEGEGEWAARAARVGGGAREAEAGGGGRRDEALTGRNGESGFGAPPACR